MISRTFFCSVLALSFNYTLVISFQSSSSYQQLTKRNRLISHSSQHRRALSASLPLEGDEANNFTDNKRKSLKKSKSESNYSKLNIDQSYVLSSSSQNTPSLNSEEIQGILPQKFQLLCRLHCTLILLNSYIPTLLTLPSITFQSAECIYQRNVTVTGPRGEQLAVGIDEVLGIIRAIAIVTLAAKQAESLLDLFVKGEGGGSSFYQNLINIEHELLIDPQNPFLVLLVWKTRLPTLPFGNPSTATDLSFPIPASTYTEFSGKTLLQISDHSGLVSNLQIQELGLDGLPLIDSLETALATIRRTARTSPIFENLSRDSASSQSNSNSFLSGILGRIREVIDTVDSSPRAQGIDVDRFRSSLYILPQTAWDSVSSLFRENETEGSLGEDENATTSFINESTTQSNVITPLPIDQYSDFREYHIPVAGSESFVQYEIIRRTFDIFVSNWLHQLAGISSIPDESNMDSEISLENIKSLFTTEADLVRKISIGSSGSNDTYTTLLQGAGSIADLFRSLRLLRQATKGDWKVTNLKSDWKKRSILISWESKSPLKIQGTDNFIFEEPSLVSSSKRLPLKTDGGTDHIASVSMNFFKVNEGMPLKVARIENIKLAVGGVATDSEWANSFINAALRSGFANKSIFPDPTLSELMLSLSTSRSSLSKSMSYRRDVPSSSMPQLEDSAAVSFYGILRSLHNDLPQIGSTDAIFTVPTGDFISDSIELRGLLGERLITGSKAYHRLIRFALSSLRTAIQSNGVRFAAPPKPTITVTARGSIKVDLILALWINAPNFQRGAAGKSKINSDSLGFGVPLKVQLISEYIIDTMTGKIREHIILESRLNEVLTPGDVFSRWIKSLTTSSSVQNTDGAGTTSALDPLLDALAWVRSMQNLQNSQSF